MARFLRSRTLACEHLEAKRLLAGVWQAAPNALDVDSSGFVEPFDVLLVVNDINQNGIRTLPSSRDQSVQVPLCDVDGDGTLAAFDVLLIVNAINQNPFPPSLNVGLTAASDGNADQVVLTAAVVYEGTTAASASVKVELLEGELVSPLAQTTAGTDGAFQLPVTLPSAVNHLRFTTTNLRGQSQVTERLVRHGDVVAAWNAPMLEMVRETTSVLSTGVLIKPPPPMVAKFLAMMHGAMFDAVNAVAQSYDAYALNTTPQTGASPIAAAAAAAHRVASHVYSTSHQLAVWDATLAEVLATVPEGSAKAAGITLGQQAGDAMIALRANDGSNATSTYQPTPGVGNWKPTTPDFSPATLPQWPQVTPFSLDSGDQFRPAPPPDLNSATYAQAVDEVMRLGTSFGSTRTSDQTMIARYWADGGGTATPPGHWNQIAVDVALNEGLGLLESARTLALLNFALADAGIAAWDSKYAYDLWRPIDAIREAANDGNSATSADTGWTPLLNTPSFPSYVSGHSTFSGAAAAVLTELFGSDYAFSSWADRGSTGQWPPSDDVQNLALRSFSSFSAAADEAGVSRIYGGIHYNFDNTAGLSSGSQIGQWVVDHALLPAS